MRHSALFLVPLLLLPLAHCSSETADSPKAAPAADGGDEDVAENDDGGPRLDPLPSGAKVDVLFVVDNSASMGDKQDLMAASLTRVFATFASADVHVGVISSSLHDGGDVCSRDNPRANDRARLLNKDKAGAVVAGAESGFLSFGPGGAVPDVATLQQRAAEIIRGVGETGCGLEAQLEAMYRFVAHPEPPAEIRLDDFRQAEPSGVDWELLAQRKAFFRPDSAVAIVMLTDEEDASIDPLAIGGFGYAFSARSFPGSSVNRGTSAQGTTAPRGTSICATDPTNEACISCGFSTTCDPNLPACQAIRNDANCKESPVQAQSGPGFDGFYGPTDDDLNVRMHDMKRRYGVEPRYPIGRYVAALSGRKLPDLAAEHPIITAAGSGQRVIGEYVQAETCSNPLFSTDLPQKEGDERCSLPPSGRDPRKVVFALIGGVPSTLLGAAPDWTKILGRDPGRYDTTGIDPHMLLSVTPRAPLSGADAPKGDNGADPIHGREWTTGKKDLQYACTFALPAPFECVGFERACDCDAESTANPPLCSGTTQVRAKAYPTARELWLAKELGGQAVVGSLCDLGTTGSYTAFFDDVARKLGGAFSQ
ncbi:MAG: hypothetical protein KIT84_32615 [Labilithrix sp.]|nr:hypothetical protein [Labilithrix sp.]MCW5815818.1 hypothetical protein [Labilithrix sp.]